jgi:hypothetical protein
MNETVKLVQPLKVHGGKNAHNGQLAKWIVSLMPPHRTCVEAYAAALADWNRHEMKRPNNAAGGKSKRKMTEVIWCNF